MIHLPPQQTLPIADFERTLDRASLTNSYKLYWFLAILHEVSQCRESVFTFERLVTLMLVKSWHTILKFRLNIGIMDQLPRIAHYLQNTYSIDPEIPEPDLEAFLNSLKDPQYNEYVSQMSRYVPYRFLTPFFESELRGQPDHQKNEIIEQCSNTSDKAIYRINSADRAIELHYKWYEYLFCNQTIVEGWSRYKLVEYLQSKNPNVPSVIDKLTLPPQRNLNDARKFWAPIIETFSIPDLYTGKRIAPDEMSLDHFIPWSFVLHDKLWNLAPVARSINSSKNDLLPQLNVYLEQFVNLQYQAFVGAISLQLKQSYLEDYLLLGGGMELSTNVNEASFKEIIRNTLVPLHQIARNQGFGVWDYHANSK